ncbi:MAG TPA: aspartate carbamoyltransferase catalytic subunit [Pseudomonadota bacterium]|nr:aspartate carbamoyltransferase catalytic subunit [Xanthomonadales bacterium]HQW63772.1 aspartate carbamoyltransferase catalytic subunit [Pseudomonadota bacterium]MBP6690991.1 aspartate carbamoyltransferase catalytic subunit [Xanthomonadales bacterium]MBP7417718.1 aspartate carbamoyltransferase catalytic subunit [Xanthomonadales bacterium]HQX24299.1 aspartate carbamoyltransferase catalytic subunit [Pseudomonadota bacterium]
MGRVQHDGDGRLRHLLSLEDLPRRQLEELLDTAEALAAATGGKVKKLPLLRGRTVVNLFFEPSTRTRVSFSLAASRLSADVVDFDVGASSASKGESVLDTLRTLEAMHCDLFVVRHRENGTPEYLARHVRPGVAVINAGDGNHAHPTQGLLDAYTIRQRKGRDFSRLVALIVGDVLHSRVARSDIDALRTLGIGELRVCAPETLLPADPLPGVRVFHDIGRALLDVDVVMMLRLQKERMQASAIPDDASYFSRYGLTPERLALAKRDAIVMHPGPMNRGVEIASGVADGPQSVILQQVSNGLVVRMAVMAHLMGAPGT